MKFSLDFIKGIPQLTKELSNGLAKLSLPDNFEGFETEVTIPSSSELAIRNEVSYTPSKYIIVNQTGNGLINRGSTAWSSNFLYLQNNGLVDVTVTIQFLR